MSELKIYEEKNQTEHSELAKSVKELSLKIDCVNKQLEPVTEFYNNITWGWKFLLYVFGGIGVMVGAFVAILEFIKRFK